MKRNKAVLGACVLAIAVMSSTCVAGKIGPKQGEDKVVNLDVARAILAQQPDGKIGPKQSPDSGGGVLGKIGPKQVREGVFGWLINLFQ